MGYRRYRRGSYYYRKKRPMKPEQAIFFVIALVVVGLIYSGNFWKAVFWGLAIWGVIVLIRKYWNKPRSSGGGGYTASTLQVGDFNGAPPTPEEDVQALAELNGEKHSSRCYMDGLTEGEQEVAYVLAEGLNYKEYYIFNNIIVPSDHNGSSQIDHLVISKFGVFVIESKDYNGWIFGSKDHEHWTQVMAGGNSKIPFPNPIRQNWSHVMSLKALLPFIPENAFYNIVVFTDSAEIKTDPIEDVVLIGDLIPSIQKHTDTPITEENLHHAIGKLSYLCQAADITPEQHLENINSRHSS